MATWKSNFGEFCSFHPKSRKFLPSSNGMYIYRNIVHYIFFQILSLILCIFIVLDRLVYICSFFKGKWDDFLYLSWGCIFCYFTAEQNEKQEDPREDLFFMISNSHIKDLQRQFAIKFERNLWAKYKKSSDYLCKIFIYICLFLRFFRFVRRR